jgi:hypothetical protein
MSARLFRTCMKHGSVLLFICFFVSFVAAFAMILVEYWQAVEFSSSGLGVARHAWFIYGGVVARSLAQAMGYSATVLAASALLFRVDKWLEAAE